jgi:hypothetical protein
MLHAKQREKERRIKKERIKEIVFQLFMTDLDGNGKVLLLSQFLQVNKFNDDLANSYHHKIRLKYKFALSLSPFHQPVSQPS